MACLLRENLSLRRLLKSDFVVINGLLASYYGLDGVTGDAFRKVSLPADSPRGGLLGMAAILAMGGNGQYTSPVERAAWVLRKLLHDPPPPAPPNVPQLARLGRQDARRARAAASPSRSSRNAQTAIARSTPSALAWRTSTPPANGARRTPTSLKAGRKRPGPSIPPPPSTTVPRSMTTSRCATSSRRSRMPSREALRKPSSNTRSAGHLVSPMKTSRQAS